MVRESQALLSQALEFGPNQVPTMASAFLERLAKPATPVERLVQRGLLLELAVQFGHTAHKTFHQQHPDDDTTAETCGFRPSEALDDWPLDLARSPVEAFRRWAARYADAFRRTHPLSCAREAEQFLKQHFQKPILADDLAARLNCPPAFLRRTFRQLTSKTLLEYQSELRLRMALRLLRDSDLKMEAIAQEVGYKSKKDLYRVVQAHLQCTPLEYRRQMQRAS